MRILLIGDDGPEEHNVDVLAYWLSRDGAIKPPARFTKPVIRQDWGITYLTLSGEKRENKCRDANLKS